jgi:hypothetical protein
VGERGFSNIVKILFSGMDGYAWIAYISLEKNSAPLITSIIIGNQRG